MYIYAVESVSRSWVAKQIILEKAKNSFNPKDCF